MQTDTISFYPDDIFQAAVVVEIWEGYLLRNRTNAASTLCTYSLDNGPLREGDGGTLVFRFTRYDWEKNIRDILAAGNIHYAVTGGSKVDVLSLLLKKTIFIAEDDPDILLALSQMLEDAGYHVRVSSCGKPVLEANYSRVDLFILDRQMPDISGLELCRQLRARAATRDTPVILISAQARDSNEALDAGASDYIEKPFEMHYLLNVVSKFTRRAM